MSRDSRSLHIPVMADEVLASSRAFGALTGWMLDGTLGLGGHTAALLEAHPELSVLGIDQDIEILELARERLAAWGERSDQRHLRMSEIAEFLADRPDGFAFAGQPCAVLMDLGVNSIHFDSRERGFSFEDGPLDMRMDQRRQLTAADVVNTWSEESLADAFFHEGGEPEARRMARAVVEARRRAPFLRTGALADVIGNASHRSGGKLHPATRCFQGLRRVVNDESGELVAALDAAEEVLCDGGLLMAISFHDGEDGVVKRFLADGASAGRWEVVTKKPLAATRSEVQRNRRARSARLRVGKRIHRTGESS